MLTWFSAREEEGPDIINEVGEPSERNCFVKSDMFSYFKYPWTLTGEILSGYFEAQVTSPGERTWLWIEIW